MNVCILWLCCARQATTAIGVVRLSERNCNVNWVRAYGYTCLKLMVPVGPYRYVRYVTIIESRPTPSFQLFTERSSVLVEIKLYSLQVCHTQTSFCRIAFHFCCIFCRKILSDKDSYGETNQLINSLKPGCAGVSHVPWLAAYPGEMTVTESCTPCTSGWLFRPGFFVGKDGICES